MAVAGSGSTQVGPWIAPANMILTRIDFAATTSLSWGAGAGAIRAGITIGLASSFDVDGSQTLLAEMRGSTDNNGSAGSMALSTCFNKCITGIEIPITKNAPLYFQLDYSSITTQCGVIVEAYLL